MDRKNGEESTDRELETSANSQYNINMVGYCFDLLHKTLVIRLYCH